MTNNKHILLIIFLILVSVVSMYYHFILSNQIKTINAINNQIKTKSELLNKSHINLTKTLENKILIQTNKIKINLLQHKMPLNTNTERGIKDLKNLSEINNIKLKNIEWGNQNQALLDEQTVVYEKAVKLSIYGEYENINSFIKGLDSLEPISIIKTIKILMDGIYLQSDFYISTYSLEGEY